MIISDLNFECVSSAPTKDDSPPIVNPYRVETFSIALRGLKSVSGRHAKITQISRFMEIQQFSPRSAPQIRREHSCCLCPLVVKEIFGEHVSERLNHVSMLSELDNFGN
jgi:hypothetical protein